MVRTIHRFQLVLAAFQLHRWEHVFAVVIEMPAGFPEIKTCGMRRIDQLIPISNMLFSPEILNQQADCRTLRMPEYQPGSDLILNADQIQLFSDFSVVA